MHRFFRALALLLSVVLVSVITSCNPNEGKPTIDPDPVGDDMFQTNQREVKSSELEYSLKPDVKIISPNQKSALKRFEDGHTLVFDASIKDHPLPKPGENYLVGMGDEVFPYGFFGKVVDVSENGSEIRVRTKRVSPYEVFDDFKLHTLYDISKAKVYGPDGKEISDGVQTRVSDEVTSRMVPINITWSPEFGHNFKGEVSASGKVEYRIKTDVNFDLKNLDLSVKNLVSSSFTVDTHVEVSAAIGFDDTKHHVGTILLPSPFGAVALGFNIYWYFSAEGKLELTTEWCAQSDSGYELVYDDNGFDVKGLSGESFKKACQELNFIPFALDLTERDASQSSYIKGSASLGMGLRGMFGIDLFGYPLYDFENLYADAWIGFQSELKYEIAEDTAYDVLKNTQLQLLLRLGIYADATALGRKVLESDIYENYDTPYGTEWTHTHIVDVKDYDVKMKLKVELENVLTILTWYLFPEYKDFSDQVFSIGSSSVVRARNTRRMLFRGDMGFALREPNKTEYAGIFYAVEPPDEYNYIQVLCKDIKPNTEYNVYPCIKFLGKDIIATEKAYSFALKYKPPKVKTLDAVNVSRGKAIFKGAFDAGDYEVFDERGFFYSFLSDTPKHDPNSYRAILPEGADEILVEEPFQGFDIYVRAYGIIGSDLIYADNIVKFTAIDNMQVYTKDARDVTTDSAELFGEFYPNGHTIKAKGFCISTTTASPDITNSEVITIPGNSIVITSLSPGTRYNFKAFMTDDKGETVYGLLKEFTTQKKNAIINVSTDYVGFADVTIGGGQNKSFFIENVGDDVLKISSIRQNGSNAFSFDAPELRVSPGAKLIVTVTFNPATAGKHTGELIITSNALDATTKTVRLEGTGVEAPKPQILLEPDPVTIGKVEVGSSGTGKFYVVNTGSAPLHVTSIKPISNSAFSVDWTQETIEAGGRKPVTVTYRPTSSGPDEDYINVKSDAANYTDRSVLVKGEGVVTKVPKISVSTSSLSMSAQVEGNVESSFTVSNDGDAPLVIESVYLHDWDAFSYTGITAPTTLAPLTSVKVTIIFSPWYQDTPITDAITFYTNDPVNRETTVNLKGSPQALTIKTKSIDFGDVGTMKTAVVKIFNESGKTMQITSISTQNLSKIELSQTRITIDSHRFADLYVTFVPTTSGSQSGQIVYTTSDPHAPRGVINVTGRHITSNATDDNGHHNAIDLGLSVKWANKNIGAEDARHVGSLFAYGETSTKSSYTTENYRFKPKEGGGTLPLANDAAHVNWGGTWRMPSRVELWELQHFCTLSYTEISGVRGIKATSKRPGFEGQFVFFPLVRSRFEIFSRDYVPAFYPVVLSNYDDSFKTFYLAGWSHPEEGFPVRGVTP